MSRFEGKVAFITGAARGQGRSHALRLAGEGADVIICDICEQIDSVSYPLSTREDLAETQRAVEALGRRAVALPGDVRSPEQLQSVVAAGLEELGRIDIIVANAGIGGYALEELNPVRTFEDLIAINLGGVRHTVQAAVPSMIEQGDGGAIVLTSSTQGLSGAGGDGSAGMDGYSAAKHGVVGLMRSWAVWLAPHRIRVNSIHPTGVVTPMIDNEVFREFVAQRPGVFDAMTNLLPVEAIEPRDVSDAVAWLASDEAQYVTGVTLPVDAGFLAK